jgi:hypothetical protein
MATQPTYPTGVTHPAQARTTTVEREGILDRWRAHRAERMQARLISARNRRVLAKWLRRTANCEHDTDPIRRRREALLHYRAAAVRTDLLEIAALIEHAPSPDPARVATLRDLLANGCDSPLYNPDIHISELHATLHHVRSGL